MKQSRLYRLSNQLRYSRNVELNKRRERVEGRGESLLLLYVWDSLLYIGGRMGKVFM